MPVPSDDRFAAPIPDDASYEDLSARLEEVVALLERGDLSLEGMLTVYEHGVALVQRCNDLLDHAELRVSELSETLSRPGVGSGSGAGYTARSFILDDDEDEGGE